MIVGVADSCVELEFGEAMQIKGSNSHTVQMWSCLPVLLSSWNPDPDPNPDPE